MTEHNYLGSVEFLRERALSVPAMPVPRATEPTAVIVPILGRPHHAEPFMDSLKASRAPYAKVYAVVDTHHSDSWEVSQAWLKAGAVVIWFDDKGRGPGTFAEKVNHAYRHTDEPWLQLVGSDVEFHSKWLDYAQHAARDGAHVIGTNDLYNQAVLFGITSAHPMIRREYIKERGASWDGPGIVCHEGYRHNFVDAEIVAAATIRNVWAFARHAVIEHMHHLWGQADHDETYALGDKTQHDDKALYCERRARFVPEFLA